MQHAADNGSAHILPQIKAMPALHSRRNQTGACHWSHCSPVYPPTHRGRAVGGTEVHAVASGMHTSLGGLGAQGTCCGTTYGPDEEARKS